MNSKPLLVLFLGLLLTACAGPAKKPVSPPAIEPEQRVETPVRATPTIDRIVALALDEWSYFGRQTVVIESEEEMIPHVGDWEDEDVSHIERVRNYWQSVGKGRLSGTDCHQPWSAAFISWVMREAGVPRHVFPSADAHWIYLKRMMNRAGYAPFLAHGIAEYRPRPGDLICATRGHPAPRFDELPEPELIKSHRLHCDIVVANSGGTLSAIGGNVRNSVSKSILKLTQEGYVQPTRSRPWFVVLENRLDD